MIAANWAVSIGSIRTLHPGLPSPPDRFLTLAGGSSRSGEAEAVLSGSFVRSGLSCLVVESDGGCYTAMPPTAMRLDSPTCTNPINNNNASGAELELLAKLEEANRLYESDAKSLNSLSGASASGHSRKSSDTSQISLTSGASSTHDRPEDACEEDLWTKWGHIVNDWEGNWKKQNAQIKELVRRGVPLHFRAIVWQLLCSATEAPEKKLYAEYIKTKSPCEKVIRRDIARTYPEHDFFKEKDGLGQESLFNVIKAYSLHDREVGYCQGSGFIVGLLLMQMPEEEAFAVLVKIMQDYRMRDMFKPSMAELGLCMYQLENLVAEYIPELSQHFQSQNFHTSMYASSWFLTLFTTALSLPLACRIMDVFLSEGMEIIFKVALAMLTLGKEELMSLDMEGMLKFFQKELPARAEADPEALMLSAYSMKYNAKKMKKLEKEYNVIKSKEQEEMAELKRLRTENKQLKHRCEMLEEESKALADRLVRGQVSRAEEEETTFVVQRELESLRHQHLETTHQLALAHEKIRSLSLMMEQTHTSRQSSIEEITIKQEQLQQREEMIECLQEELVKVRLREAENDALIRELRSRIHELEEDKKTLREITPDNSVAHLQEELIAVKLREAEANLSLKDLRQRVSELSQQWQRHLQEHKQENASVDVLSTPKKLLFWENKHNETQKLEEELMTTRIREMETLTEVKELRLKVMELETQVQVGTNQLKRQDEEIKKQKEKLEGAELRDREAAARLLEEQRRYADLESKMQDELMKARISDAEKTQAVAELTQKISQLELKSQEIATEGELRIHSVDDSDRVRELQDKVADLQAEVSVEEARKRNLHLKEKKVYLENEVDGFQFKMIDNNMKKAERKEGLDTLTAEVQKLRKQNNDVKYRLEVANEEIIILNEKLDNYKTKISETRSELKPISDDLKSGSDLLDCLQEVLLKLRLRSAEKESTIIELKAVLKELQAEADTLREQKPDSVRMLQEQLMQQTCRERETLEEFRRIKKELGELSEEVHCFCLQQDDSLEPFSANFNFFEAKRKAELKGDIERSVMRTINLLEEKDHLVFKINRLEDDLDEIKKKSYFNESLRLNLEEVAKSVKMKENEFQDEMKKKREKFEFLEGAMQEKIGKIKTEEANKDDLLKELSCRIEKLTLEILETEKAVYAEGKSAIKIEELEEMCEKLEKQL